MISTYLGVETGDDSSLTVYNKKVASNQTVAAINTLRELGMTGSTNGIITFHQEVTLEQVTNCIDFLLHVGMCTIWNISSRAETLPGIRLNDSMTLRDRTTAWDIANYDFLDGRVDVLYQFIANMKKIYVFPRLEDRLTRVLLDKIRIKSFFENENGIGAREERLQRDIIKVQRRNHQFIMEVVAKIASGERVKVTSDHSLFASEMMVRLRNFQWTYADLIPVGLVGELQGIPAQSGI